MKKANKYRRQGNVKILEKALSISDRLFSMLAVRRGAARLRKFLLILLLVAPIVAGIVWVISYTIDKAYSLSIEHITYDSRQKLISKEQAMQLLGIEGSINMATLDASGMEELLESNPCIESAHIRAELPDTLSIELDERIPIVYVEMEHAADLGNRTRLFMDPKGYLFPVVPEYHGKFLGVPVWYLNPQDVREFKAGERIDEKYYSPIVQLVAASNRYSLVEIPAIREIFRPKEWKIVLSLEGGISVLMQVYGIRAQMERLAMILEHARATGKKVNSINVFPALNPTATFIAPAAADTPQDEEKDKPAAPARQQRSSRRR